MKSSIVQPLPLQDCYLCPEAFARAEDSCKIPKSSFAVNTHINIDCFEEMF